MEIFLNVTGQMLEGFVTSLALFALTLIFSLPLGLLISFCTRSSFTPLRLTFKVIVWILRGTPLMLQIFAIYYVPGLLFGFVWPQLSTGLAWLDDTFSTRFIAALAAFIINYAAYFSEIFRGGIQSVPRGQYEAGKVLGMSRRQIFFKVVLLQVVQNVLPPVSNEIITLVKDTSLARVIAVTELIFIADKLTRKYVWAVFYAGLFYLIFNGVVTLILNKIEKKLEYFRV